MFDPNMDKYQPRHVHIERRPGSATGGLSQITFGDEEPENNPPGPPPQRSKGRHAYAARNEMSSVFNTTAQAPDPKPSEKRLFPDRHRESGASRLIYEEAAAPPPPPQPRTYQYAPPPRDPILGRGEAVAPVPEPAPTRYDVNRSSLAGGIFGTDPAADPPPPRPKREYNVNAEQEDAPYKSKIIINGRMEYCA